MKLKKTEIPELVRTLKGDGLFTANLRYKVTEASGELDYCGPKIPHDVWQQILSFFKWTYDTTQSESQVRLFVSPKLGTWKAWAFPQKAETGLSTKELSTDDAKAQRAALFENDADWTAWGTVHHHCNISAFQSGTDESDEKNVGGLHITVGDMDKPQHSIHARLYHQGDLYEPDMSEFWDIGDAITRVPEELRQFFPADLGDRMAKTQMCQPSSIPFPDQWKANLIKVERGFHGGYEADWHNWERGEDLPLPNPNTVGEGATAWRHGDRYVLKSGKWEKENWNVPVNHSTPSTFGGSRAERIKDALQEINESLAFYNMEATEVMELLDELKDNTLAGVILEACNHANVEVEDILDEMNRILASPTAASENNLSDPNWYKVD